MSRMKNRTGFGRLATELVLAAAMGLLSTSGLCGELVVDSLTVKDRAAFYGPLTLTRMTTPTNSQQVYYSCDTSATPVPDDSGNGYSATVYGATYTNAGWSGGAYAFSGTNQYLASGAFNQSVYSNECTATVWVKRRSSSQNRVLVSTVSDGKGFEMYYNGVGGEQGYKAILKDGQGWTGCWTYSSTGFATDLNQWVHLAMVYDGSSLKLYRNAVVIATDTYCYGNIQFPANASYAVGNQTNGLYGADALIDEVRIYGRALSSNEVLAAYAGVAGDPTLSVDAPSRFEQGLMYVAPLGDLQMGAYTNEP